LKEEFNEELTELYAANENMSDSLDYIEILTDLGQIRSRWLELQEGAMFEILGFNKPPFAVSLAQIVSHQKKVSKKKVKEIGIYEFSEVSSVSSLKDFLAVTEMYLNIGEDVKVIEKLPMKIMIIDEKITMLALNDPVSMKPSITTIIINYPDYAKAQKKVFESYWNDSQTLSEFKKNMKHLLKNT